MTRTAMWAGVSLGILFGCGGEAREVARWEPDAAPSSAPVGADSAVMVLADPADPAGPGLVLPVPAELGVQAGPVHAVVVSELPVGDEPRGVHTYHDEEGEAGLEGAPPGALVALERGGDPYDWFPAMSADGRFVVSAREEPLGRSVALVWTRVGSGRRVRALDVGYELEGPDVARATRILRRGAYRRMALLEPSAESLAELDAAGAPARRVFEGEGVRVDYDPNTGGLTVRDGDGRLLIQRLVPARRLDFTALALDEGDEWYAREPFVPDLYRVAASPDGRTLWMLFGLCDCSCDMRPFPEVFTVGRSAYP